MNKASTVDNAPFRRILVVMILAHCVAVGPLCESLALLTMMQTRWFLDFLGLMDTTIHSYLTLLPTWTSDRQMKKMVFVPLMQLPKTCDILPMLLVNAIVKVDLLGPSISCVYPCMFPVTGSSTPWKAMAPSPMASSVWLDRVHDLRG